MGTAKVRKTLTQLMIESFSFNPGGRWGSYFFRAYPFNRHILESAVLAGLAPINASIFDDSSANLATVTFALYYRSILVDGSHVVRIPPHSCSGNQCFSYYFPGGLGNIFPRFRVHITPNPDATAYIVKDAPGYQVEFYPISTADPGLRLDDCQVFGTTLYFTTLQFV